MVAVFDLKANQKVEEIPTGMYGLETSCGSDLTDSALLKEKKSAVKLNLFVCPK